MSVNEIISLVALCVLSFVAIFMLFFYLAYSLKMNELRKDYLNNASEHDKAIIIEYCHIKPSLKDFKDDGK